MKIREIFYLQFWFIKAKFFGKKNPLQTVIFITDYCNLSCKHCNELGHKGTIMKGYYDIKKELIYSYEKGSRFVDFEGGEPTLWSDGGFNLNDLFALAKKIGFFSTTLTTNAQVRLDNCKADSIWVSLDGIGKYHDEIRGKGEFEKLDKNIDYFNHESLSLNMAINKINKDSVKDTIQYAKDKPAIKSISLNFHTPYPGTEDLMISLEEKIKIIDEIIALKKEGYPIMNSISGLKTMKRKKFKKYCWITNFIMVDGLRLDECPGSSINICSDCGFCMAGEMHSIMNLKFDTVFAGLKLRVK